MPLLEESIRSYAVDDFPSLADAARHHLEETGARPGSAVLAVAGRVEREQARMTNHPWVVSAERVRDALDLESVLLVNDFVAQSAAVRLLREADLAPIGAPARIATDGDEPRTYAVLGPGTGLGVSGVIPTADGFITLGSEGGHVNFAPGDEREFAILQTAWKEWQHVSNERLISGPGMEIIHRALAGRNGVVAPARKAAEIVNSALDEQDPLCLETLECFCGMLGAAAANLAVTLGAFGGIFIGGGIVPRMGEWFAGSPFRARFEAKGRFSNYLADIPTYVITTPNPALHGVATILAEHLRGRSGANTLMERVQNLRHSLSPAEQRVAALVIEQPRLVLNEPIAEIARLADVSQPTVIRFCRSLGFQGLAEFKQKFASSLTGAIPVRHSQVRTSDSTHDLSAKVIDNTVSAILRFRDQLDVRSLDRAIELVSRARRVEFFAMGNSRAVALDGQHKFFRFRIPTSLYGDSHLFKLAAELLQPGDVVIAVSNSGSIAELLEAVDIARRAGADVIVISNSQSPLARKATVCLAVDHAEDSTSFLSMISRILQLLLIDILAVGISVDGQHGETEGADPRRLLISHLDS